MLKPPCQGCPDRTCPKHCELTCEKWISYRAKKDKENETIKKNKKPGGQYVIELYKGIK